MRALLFFILFLCFSEMSLAQQAEWKVDSTHFLMGAPLNATLVVKGIQNNTQVLFPYFDEDSTASIDFISAKSVDSSVNGIQQQMINFMAFDTGWFSLPQAMILIQKNNRIDTIYPNTLHVHVFSLPIDTLKSFRINKALLDVPFHWREFLWWMIGGIALVLLLILIIWLFKRPKSIIPCSIQVAEEIIAPYEWARRELLLLEKSDLLIAKKEKEFQSKLTEILRVFLAREFKMPTLEATSDEIILHSAKHIRPSEITLLKEIFTQADMVKFAKLSLNTETHWDSLRKAYQFIDVYKPSENNPS